ncbi:MAG: dCTP deaminase [Candidatus Binatia bacterium]
MVLSQPDLRRAVKTGKIAFDPPLEENQWGEASVDLRLGFSFTRLKELKNTKVSVAEGLGTLGAAGFWETMVLKERNAFGKPETFPLGPGEFVLAFTYESISVPTDLIALVEGRSTYARVGLSMHQTAPWIQPGWSGSIVLEMMNNGPLTIELTPLIDRPCQLTFFKLSKPLPQSLGYGARATDVYKDQTHPLVHPRSTGQKPVRKAKPRTGR